jgi:hypothetical protein
MTSIGSAIATTACVFHVTMAPAGIARAAIARTAMAPDRINAGFSLRVRASFAMVRDHAFFVKGKEFAKVVMEPADVPVVATAIYLAGLECMLNAKSHRRTKHNHDVHRSTRADVFPMVSLPRVLGDVRRYTYRHRVSFGWQQS